MSARTHHDGGEAETSGRTVWGRFRWLPAAPCPRGPAGPCRGSTSALCLRPHLSVNNTWHTTRGKAKPDTTKRGGARSGKMLARQCHTRPGTTHTQRAAPRHSTRPSREANRTTALHGLRRTAGQSHALHFASTEAKYDQMYLIWPRVPFSHRLPKNRFYKSKKYLKMESNKLYFKIFFAF